MIPFLSWSQRYLPFLWTERMRWPSATRASCEGGCGLVAIGCRTWTQRIFLRSTSGRRVRATASTSGSSGMLILNCFGSRRQLQRVLAGSGFGGVAEGGDDGFAFVPVGKLIGVMAATN